MPRRRGNKRKNDFDDTLERSYVMSKRPREEAAVEESNGEVGHRRDEQPSAKTTTRATVEQQQQQQQQATDKKISEKASLDRLREKKRQRKELKKAKIEERRQKEKIQAEERSKQKQLIQQQKKRQLEEKTKLSSSSHQPDGQIITTRKGVQYQDIVIGTGPEIRMGKQIHVKYTLRSAPGKGKILDSSQNFATKLGRGEVIEGWDIGLKGMKRGGLRHLIVPPQAGYGQQNIGAGKGALLYFEIRLLSC